MGKPAARVGDSFACPPNPKNPLAPGPGASLPPKVVLIKGKPAWRAMVDTCICPVPIAPPAPAPHGPKKCYLGSLGVLINGKMAVRMGDTVVGPPGPPSPIISGELTVLIGDTAFGLAELAAMLAFCAEFAKVMQDWNTMSTAQREAALSNVANNQLQKSGLPSQRVVGDSSYSPGNAAYNFRTNEIQVSKTLLGTSNLHATQAQQLANNIYHESRHAEQWFLVARQLAGQGNSAAQIYTMMGVTPGTAIAASKLPLSGISPQSALAETCHDSIYGSRGSYRNGVLNDINNKYPEYRALPEEQDAWNTGDALPCGKP